MSELVSHYELLTCKTMVAVQPAGSPLQAKDSCTEASAPTKAYCNFSRHARCRLWSVSGGGSPGIRSCTACWPQPGSCHLLGWDKYFISFMQK